MTFQELCNRLETKIISSYERSISLEDAEKLAAEFLSAQFRVSSELSKADLDARMKKTGLKAIRAAAYTGAAAIIDGKKPTEAAISATVDTNTYVKEDQEKLDKAEVNRDELQRYYNIFQAAHVHYRNVAKGSFGG